MIDIVFSALGIGFVALLLVEMWRGGLTTSGRMASI
jgi:hypothetical protein